MDRDPSQRELDEGTRRDLTRLADGSLEEYPRAQLEARLDASPALRAALERQRMGAATVRGLDLEAPASLRARIESAAASTRRGGARRGRRPDFWARKPERARRGRSRGPTTHRAGGGGPVQPEAARRR